MRLATLIALVLASPMIASIAHADDDFDGATVIFVRGNALYRTDPRGKTETELVQLTPPGSTAKPDVRALRTDARGAVLLVDIAGKWSWMPLDGSATALTPLPCADGPAQLAVDGACVLCRAPGNGPSAGSMIYNLKSGRSAPLNVPAPGARLVSERPNRKLIWGDASGIWSAPQADTRNKKRVGPEAPLRGLLPSPDGTRAIGTYADVIHEGRHTKPGELLMVFALDGQAARRKTIRNGVPVEWSHDSQWVLVQDGASACVVRATGGDYKCWKGYTAASISSNGRYALVLGNRDGSKQQARDAKSKASKRDKGKRNDRGTKSAGADQEGEQDAQEPGDEPDASGAEPSPADDVAVAPPSGPLALYRVQIDGAFTASPARIVQVVDGAAVWVPAKR
ncbi:MAG: hypothetical protein AB7P03_16210 [Kofleriaceae bacterium]